MSTGRFATWCVVAALAAAVSPAVLSADGPLDRWAAAVGGRGRLAAIHGIYREATIDVAGYSGSIKAWHTNDGRYRKEERVASYAVVETFDGQRGVVSRAGAPPQLLEGADLARTRSVAFANWAAVFLAFFPQRVPGTRTVEGEDTIVLHREGGIDWRVRLDPATSLPTVMTHREGERTVTVTFVKYEKIDGLVFEQEIRRTNGIPMYDALIRFTKTVVNAPVDAALFRQSPGL